MGRTLTFPKPKLKFGWLVIFCSKQHQNDQLRPVGWYEDAEFETNKTTRPRHATLRQQLQRLWKKIRYTVSSEIVYLIPVESRKRFPPIPTGAFRRPCLYARVDGKKRYPELADLAERIVSLKRFARRVGDSIDPLQSEETKDLRRLFDKAAKKVARSENVGPEEARIRVLASILQRPGQVRFRERLLRSYGGVCAISDCDCSHALEAAHILAYGKGGKNRMTNGLLLRADLHKLFDQGKISIHPTKRTVLVSDELKRTVYGKLNGQPLKPPKSPAHAPTKEGLGKRYNEWKRSIGGR